MLNGHETIWNMVEVKLGCLSARLKLHNQQVRLAKILNPVKLLEGSLTAEMKTAAEVMAEMCWDQLSCDFTRQ